MRIVTAGIILLGALAIATSAPAKPRKKYRAQPIQAAKVCQPLCTADVSPCDPPEFKRVDGRCDFGHVGGAGAGGFR